MYGVQVANPVRPSMCADLFILARSAFEFDTPGLEGQKPCDWLLKLFSVEISHKGGVSDPFK